MSAKQFLATFNESWQNLEINSLSETKVVKDFRHTVKFLINNRIYPHLISWNIQENPTYYPNIVVPIISTIEHYSNTILANTELKIPEYLRPLDVRNLGSDEVKMSNKIWRFSSIEEVHDLTDRTVRYLQREVEFVGKTIESLEYFLNEALDNIITHSQAKYGYFMFQVHRTNGNVALCIGDVGQGILNSFRNSKHRFHSGQDALIASIKEGVTSGAGQGNGLWILKNVIEQNLGSLIITSSSAMIKMERGVINSVGGIEMISNNSGTFLDIQFNPSSDVDINNFLGSTYVSLRLEDYLDDRGEYLYKVKDRAKGVGTRPGGFQCRNEVKNIINEASQRVVVDFEGISIISSSFADEFLGKLAQDLGIISFGQYVHIINTGETVNAIISRAIAQRLASGYNFYKF